MKFSILGRDWGFRFVPRLSKKRMAECDPPDAKNKEIRVLSKLRGQVLLEAIVHEHIHAAGWHIDEEFVEQLAADVARNVWRDGIRERIFENS